ncbi:cupin-like domain-containing protein [Candidatus Spongiihabitans sp.]|uniref:cupin-like domain-containing protein n=1 Tax=Candidatus Spongiihabitans sp. TaxID=3101308 RepID=UPI003C6F416C
MFNKKKGVESDYKKCNPIEVTINPGEMLFLPATTLHHVFSIDMSISVNIDFHTSATSLKGLTGIKHGMPLKNSYYNVISFLGLVCKVPSRFLFPLYQSYLNYVS